MTNGWKMPLVLKSSSKNRRLNRKSQSWWKQPGLRSSCGAGALTFMANLESLATWYPTLDEFLSHLRNLRMITSLEWLVEEETQLCSQNRGRFGSLEISWNPKIWRKKLKLLTRKWVKKFPPKNQKRMTERSLKRNANLNKTLKRKRTKLVITPNNQQRKRKDKRTSVKARKRSRNSKKKNKRE